MKNGERELSVAIEIAREAGALLKENFGKVQEVDFKGRINLVTEMDRKSERLIVDRLRKAFPGDDVWAEEGGGSRTGAERVWVVDPIDGTTNYAHEYPVFSVSIGLQVAGRMDVGVVYNPLLDDVYAARRGGGAMLNGRPRRVTQVDTLERAFLATGFAYDVTATDPERNNLGPFGRFLVRAQALRRAGSASLAIAKVGVGRTDGFWERGLHAWDMAAALVIVEEGGGKVTDYRGGPPTLEGGELVASNGPLHGPILEVLAMRGAATAAPRAGIPSETGDPPPEWAMRKYVIGFLFRGPNRVEDEKESDRLQRAHLANIARLHEEGKIILAGPFLDKTELRGVFLFDVET
ncbi:MAG TPA: inositol monophosphatase family protein, partial [Candidatus Eisenbacteria bacterium]|nr:inositol monophosphatase family protein [Candidatus Eisenbacteria bacterium]